MDFSQLAQQIAPFLSVYFPDFDGTRDLGRGTAFPTTNILGGLTAGDRFFRTDLSWACTYDGTRWITAFTTPMILIPNRSTIAANTTLDTRVRTDYALYIEYFAISTNVVTTNNGTNFWTITIQGVNLALSAATTVFNPNTGTTPDTAGVETDHSGAVAAGSVAPANNAYIRVAAAKTLAPGNLTYAVTAYVRWIVT